MDFNEFAETVKAKHPEYKDRDNRTLAEAVVKKYPEYASKVTFPAPDKSGYPDTQDPESPRYVPGVFPAQMEHDEWTRAIAAHPNDYYAAKKQVLDARNKYTQTRPEGSLSENLQGASGIVAATGMAPLGMGQDAVRGAGREIQRQYPGMAGSLIGGALKYGSNAIPASPKQIVANEAAGAVIGAAMPYVNKVAGAAGNALEGLSGLEYKTPGVLKDAANDASLIFGPGKKAAGLAYEEIKDDLQVRPAFLESTSSANIIDLAKYALENGDLSPQEALIARRALDDKFGGIPASTANYLRPKFDAIAKTITAEADAGFKRAIKSDAMRQILATNKGGGTSIAKLVLGGLTGGVLNVVSSPVVQGAAATVTGMAGRAIESTPNYIRGASVNALLNKRKKDQENGD
jgi:hypothetical protein